MSTKPPDSSVPAPEYLNQIQRNSREFTRIQENSTPRATPLNSTPQSTCHDPADPLPSPHDQQHNFTADVSNPDSTCPFVPQPSHPSGPVASTPDAPDPYALDDSNSTLLTKLPPHIRRAVNKALVERNPPTYAAVFDHFDLLNFDISYTAFFYYARRVRARAAARQLARSSELSEAELPGRLTHLFATRLFEALMDEESHPRVLRCLTDAWRIAHNIRTSDADARKDFLDDVARDQSKKIDALRLVVRDVFSTLTHRAAHTAGYQSETSATDSETHE